MNITVFFAPEVDPTRSRLIMLAVENRFKFSQQIRSDRQTLEEGILVKIVCESAGSNMALRSTFEDIVTAAGISLSAIKFEQKLPSIF